MQKSVIEDFFDHVLQRQTAQGPERAFRFKAIKGCNGTVDPTHYPDDLNNPPPSQRTSKCSSRRNANTMPDAESATGTGHHPAAEPNAEAQGQSRSRKRAKRKSKGKQPRRQSTTAQTPNSEPNAAADPEAGARTGHHPDADSHSPDPDTSQSSYVQVNQATMDVLYTAGVTRPQPINGPGDGDPEYLIPRQIYMRYITPPSVPNDNVNDPPCPIDPSLLEDNTNPPQQVPPRPLPQRLVGGIRTQDPIARAMARAQARLGMPLAMATI